jgi:hypothetical protein
VLIALTDDKHLLHVRAIQWFEGSGYRDWGVCALTGAGFLRLLANPQVGSLTVAEATDVFAALIDHPGYRFWPINDDWASLSAPFIERVFGHQQITDAYLLGLAIKEGGILVTMDKGIKYLAGTAFSKNVLLLE